MQVDDYEDDDIDSDYNGDDGNELPTVVIDSSMDEKELAQQYRQMNDSNNFCASSDNNQDNNEVNSKGVEKQL
jgi:hypothetical protein